MLWIVMTFHRGKLPHSGSSLITPRDYWSIGAQGRCGCIAEMVEIGTPKNIPKNPVVFRRVPATVASPDGGCSSMVELQFVVLAVAGSSPVSHPGFFSADGLGKIRTRSPRESAGKPAHS